MEKSNSCRSIVGYIAIFKFVARLDLRWSEYASKSIRLVQLAEDLCKIIGKNCFPPRGPLLHYPLIRIRRWLLCSFSVSRENFDNHYLPCVLRFLKWSLRGFIVSSFLSNSKSSISLSRLCRRDKKKTRASWSRAKLTSLATSLPSDDVTM